MTIAFFVGRDGGLPKVRLSRPGFDALSAGAENLVIHESIGPPPPLQKGQVLVAASGAVDVPTPFISPLPLCVFFAIGQTTGDYSLGEPDKLYALMKNGWTSFRFRNKTGQAYLFHYYIYDRSIG